jgi:hypothetical protein
MRRRACAATIIAVAAPVIAAIAIVEVPTTVVVASHSTNQTIIAALTASQLTSLVAREPAVRTENAPLVSDRTSALAQQERLVACDLPCGNAAPDTVAITAATMALGQRRARQAKHRTYRAQKKNPFHHYKPFPFKFYFVSGGNFGLTAACTRTVGESFKIEYHFCLYSNYQATPNIRPDFNLDAL